MSTSDRWLCRYHGTGDARTELVCFPHAGASATYFHPTSRHFAPGVDVLAVQYPGRQNRRREPLIPRLDQLADEIFEVLLSVPAKPRVFFGHSMGATLAFEVAQRLEHKGHNAPDGLVLSGRRAPSTHRDETVHLRSDEGVLTELRELSGTNPAFLADPELVAMVLPAIRNDYQAIETYTARPGITVRCPIKVLLGDADPKVTPDEGAQWREHTTGQFSLRTFAGGHFFIETHSGEVTSEIAAALREL
jgi:surfactin synthase thioesterase subunit